MWNFPMTFRFTFLLNAQKCFGLVDLLLVTVFLFPCYFCVIFLSAITNNTNLTILFHLLHLLLSNSSKNCEKSWKKTKHEHWTAHRFKTKYVVYRVVLYVIYAKQWICIFFEIGWALVNLDESTFFLQYIQFALSLT